jgi:hypothetical protein
MTRSTSRRLLTFGYALCAMLISAELARVGALSPPVPRLPVSRAGLYQDSRAELALARARGETTVTLVVAARDGATEAVAHAVAAAGGIVRFRHDVVGYLRAEVPIDQADAVAEGQAVESVALDFSSMRPSAMLAGPRGLPPDPDATSDFSLTDGPTRPSDAGPSSLQQPTGPPLWSDAAFTHPYSPVTDLGAAELKRVHPTYDGRGITIGHVERTVDLLIPELETARTLDGAETPKIVEVRATTDPDHTHGPDAGRRIWVKMTLEVATAGGRFTAADASYTAPRDGRFRFGVFDGAGLCASTLTRRDAAPPSASECRFGVLWDEQTQVVWVDTTRDRNFADERALADFRVRRDIATLGRDDPGTPEREQLAFTLQIDPAKRAIAVNVGIGGHATSVASSAAGSRGARGRFDGVAPGARLINFDYGSECVAGVIEGLIAAFSDPRVDLVLYEQNSLIVKAYRLGDARHPATIVTARLIEKYKKPYVVPASNPPGLNATSEHGNARWGFAVGTWEAKAAYRINGGYLVAHDDNRHTDAGAAGPNGLGEIKPDVVVPSGYLASFMPIPNYTPAFSGLKGLYRFPPGYGIFGGTSQGAPTMAGALALLMSAAKQERVPYDAERIWLAVTSSARQLPHLRAHEQGHGAVDVTAALALLKAYAKTPPGLTVESSSSVRSAYSAWLTPPHQGVGLWEQEGWRAGQRGERTITFTRTSGPAEPMTFAVSWQGNDGTFGSAPTLTLPLRTPTPLAVTVAPTAPGPHSAIVTLDHPSMPGHVYRTMATIVAAEPFEAGRQFALTKKDRVDRPGPFTSYHLDVPPGVDALSMRATGASLWVLDPINRGTNNAGPPSRLVSLPRPGVWEAILEIDTDKLDLAWMTPVGQLAPPVPTTFDASVLGARLHAPTSLSLAPGASQTIEVGVENAFGVFEGGLTTTAMAAARTVSTRLPPGGQRVFDVQVPEGSPLLLAEVTGTSVPEAEIDLYLFDCTGKQCVSAGATLGLGSQPRLRRVQPKAGMWKVVVDASRAPEGGIAFDYTDAVADPALGSVAVTDVRRTRAVGARWMSQVNVWLAMPPPSGRDPRALLLVSATESGTTVPVALRMVPVVVKGAADQRSPR